MDRTAASYIAEDRRWAMSRGEALPDRTSGAVLFADISGFTPIAEALARSLGASRGAEELSHLLNRVYDVLIAEVDRLRGSVIGFSGDAITCWFAAGSTSEDTVADAVVRATATGLAMQRAMQRFVDLPMPDRENLTVGVKIGIASGPTRRFQVGDPAVQLLDVVAGRTLARMATAERLAARGEVVLDEPSAQALRERVRLREWRSSSNGQYRFAVVERLEQLPAADPWGEFAIDDDEALRSWLLPDVQRRLLGGQGEFTTELRPAVSLFARFEGIDYDEDDSAGEKLNAFVCWVQNVVARYEGTLLDVTIGDKGSYLCVAFGAPIAHEDDARRAALVAYELSRPPSECKVAVLGIGVSQGTMRAGSYGARSRRTYAVLGDEVNVAARLMQRAQPGQIIVSQRVVDSTSAHFQFEFLGAVPTKGKRDAVPGYGLVARIPEASISAAPRRCHERQTVPLMGRAGELGRVKHRLHGILSQQKSGVVLIEGEPGIGKSRLVDHVVREAQAHAITPRVGAADAIEHATPYFAWREPFRHLLGMDEPSDDRLRRARLVSALDGNAQLEALLPLVAGPIFGIAEVERTDGGHASLSEMSSEARAENAQRVLVHLLRRAATAPLLIILEDAHWFDSASWALAARVVRDVKPLLLLITMRPLEIEPDELGELRSHGAEQIELGRLSPTDTVALAAHSLGVPSLPAPIAALIAERADGNPFFAEQLAYAVSESGALVIERGEARQTDGGNAIELTAPDTVQDVVRARIDRLPPEPHLTLKVASVVGRVFLENALRAVHPVAQHRTHLDEHLITLDRGRFTEREPEAPHPSHRFTHALTQEAAYNLLLFAQRRDLHRAVAEWYEHAHAQDLTPYHALLAHHWSKTGTPERALEHLSKAGEQALACFANKEAVEFFGAALAQESGSVTNARRRARWERQLGQALLKLGKIDEGAEHLDRALALNRQPLSSRRSSPAVAVGLLGQAVVQLLTRLSFQRERPRGLGDDTARSQLIEASQAHERRAELFYLSNDPLRLVDALIRSLNLAERAGPSAAVARGYANLCLGASVGGMHRLADAYRRRALETAGALGQPLAELEVVRMAAYHPIGLGRWTEARTELERVTSAYRQNGDRSRWGECSTVLALLHHYQGHFEVSERINTEVMQVAGAAGDLMQQAWGMSGRAANALALGRDQEASSLAEQSLGLIGKSSDRINEIVTRGVLAAARWRLGDQDGAFAHAAPAAAALIESKPTSFYLLEAYATVGDVYQAAWEAAPVRNSERDRMRTTMRNVRRATQRFARAFPIGAPRAQLLLGTEAWLAGRRRRAEAAWRRCIAAAERLEMPKEAEKAKLELQRRLGCLPT